jgi:hypothetical protein
MQTVLDLLAIAALVALGLAVTGVLILRHLIRRARAGLRSALDALPTASAARARMRAPQARVWAPQARAWVPGPGRALDHRARAYRELSTLHG